MTTPMMKANESEARIAPMVCSQPQFTPAPSSGGNGLCRSCSWWANLPVDLTVSVPTGVKRCLC